MSNPNTSFEELRTSADTAREALNATLKQLGAISQKIDNLSNEIPVSRETKARAELKRKKVLEDICLEKASQRELDAARLTVEEAARHYSDSEELLAAMIKTKDALEVKVPEQTSALQRAERTLWLEIYAELREQLNTVVGDLLIKVFAAASKAHPVGTIGVEAFFDITTEKGVFNLFEPKGRGALNLQAKELTVDLAKEYGIELSKPVQR